jgi:hypothetical protein
MKKLFLSFFLMVPAFASGNAQVPEFALKVKFFRDVATTSNKTIAFGFDANASDTLEGPQKWLPDLGGEQLAPPAGFDWDFRLTGNFIGRISDLQGGSYVDIRKKPNDMGFILLFEMDMIENDFTKARIEWDNSSIPAKIKHIMIASNQDPFHPRLDMKNTSSFDFPSRDSIQYYGSMVVKLYYNQEPADVRSQVNISSDEFTLYPNPMDSRSKLHFFAKDDSRMTLSAYDVTGRKVFERMISAHAGENTIDLGRDDISAHSGVYLIRLSGIEGGKSFEKSTTIIVR